MNEIALGIYVPGVFLLQNSVVFVSLRAVAL
ncbi:hypothetical protein HIMB100_00003290 [SAR116 cluster alpha proteobacterium HIMB100]|nr:hypothetical protein HIMB100_00003290 [SAR116 cluster alpha proteobacterium HIMB100]